LREKKVRGFSFGSLEYQKNYKLSNNIEKTPYRRVAKKGTILHQAPQITLFLTHPVLDHSLEVIYRYLSQHVGSSNK